MDNYLFYIAGYVIIFCAATIQGLTGFGFGLMTVPFLALLIYPKTVIPLVLIYTVLISATVLFQARRQVNIRRVLPLLAAALCGLIPGAMLLKYLPAEVLRIYIGTAITVFAGLMLFGLRVKVANERKASVPAGLISGILSGSLSTGGPPVILFFSNQAVDKEQFRANLSFYFFVLNFLTVPIYFIVGIITWEVIKTVTIFLPALIAGSAAGILFSRKVNEVHFRRIALVLVAMGGISSLVSGLSR